jgi:SAM-dependent methyltransferase
MSEFDKFSQSYETTLRQSLKGVGSLDSALKSKLQVLQKIIGTPRKRDSYKILDFGCGKGLLSEVLSQFSTDVTGVDVSLESLRNSVTDQNNCAVFDGTQLPFQDHSFSFAVASCVFHHIDPASRSAILKEIKRVLIPGGKLLIIEHNPYNPVTRFIVNRCEFDQDAVLLSMSELKGLLRNSGYRAFATGYFYTFPPQNDFLSYLDSLFSRIPVGAQYYCAYSTDE